jgi:hypothetical protein
VDPLRFERHRLNAQISSLAMIFARSGMTPMRSAAPPTDAVPFAGSPRMRRISLGRSGRPNAPVILPPQTRGLVSCLSQREDLGQCHALAGGDAALRQALGTVDRLKADGRSSLGQESSGAIRNIIGVSKGIRDDDWASVLRYGGPEVYKAAVKIVLNVLFPGLGPLIDRVTEEVVQSRVDLVEGLIKAAKARDQQKIAQLTIEFYLVMNIIPSCAIVPPGDFKNATCGSIGEVVQALAKSGGELTDFAVNRLEDVLNLVGIDTGRPFFSECGTSSNYYASRYLRCLHRGVYRAQGWEDVEGVVASHNNRCRRHYGGPPKECHVQSSLGPICEPLNSQFRSNVRDVSAGLTSAARAYVGSMRSFVQSKGVRACAADFDRIELRQFTDQCESSLRKRIPLLGAVGPQARLREGDTARLRQGDEGARLRVVGDHHARAGALGRRGHQRFRALGRLSRYGATGRNCPRCAGSLRRRVPTGGSGAWSMRGCSAQQVERHLVRLCPRRRPSSCRGNRHEGLL